MVFHTAALPSPAHRQPLEFFEFLLLMFSGGVLTQYAHRLASDLPWAKKDDTI